MDFYDINKLKRDAKQDNLYNLFAVTFKDVQNPNYPLNTYVVPEEKYMRLDLVSKELYTTESYVDILCNVNSIDNPLNILETDRLSYPNQGAIDAYKTDDVYVEAVAGLSLNAEKTTKVDENRKSYVEKNYNLTPTANEVPKEPVKIIKDTIRIGD